MSTSQKLITSKSKKSKLNIGLKITAGYFLTCVVATIVLQLNCICRYLKNENISEVKYAKYYSSEDAIYPSFSICILPPFIEKRFDEYGDGINSESYSEFLKGNLWDERMLHVDYDNVTVSMSDNVLGASSIPFTNENGSIESEPDYFISFKSGNRKCFTVNLPILDQKQLFAFKLFVRNDILPRGRRCTGKEVTMKDCNGFFWYAHYPGQRFTGYYTIKYDWPLRINKSSTYVMSFTIKNVDVVTRRNKSPKPCIEDWMNFDQQVMNRMMFEAGCRPPHWSGASHLPTCFNATQMKIFESQPYGFSERPCKNIERVDYVYEEYDGQDSFVNYGFMNDLKKLGG